MSSLSRDLVFLILKFLDEENFKETVHKLEQESAYFFNMRYFEDMVTNGEWEEVEKYLSGFTKLDDNRVSWKIFFEIRKQNYLEALDKKDRSTAVEILVKELKVFAAFDEDLFKEITQLLTLENIRDNEQLSKYGDTKSARGIMLAELKELIEANPLFRDKLQFPTTLKSSRLQTLINQSLNWQHQLCKNPRPNPDIKTLFVDHSCDPPNRARAPSPVINPLMGAVPMAIGFPPLSAHGPFRPTPAPLPTSLAGWISHPSSAPHPSTSAGPIALAPNNTASMLQHPRNPPTSNPAMDCKAADSDNVLKRTRPSGMSDNVHIVNKLPLNLLPVEYTSQSSISSDDLPKTLVMALNQGSAVKSMDFHPMQQIILLAGTNMGDVMVWDLGRREKIAMKSFKVWKLGACSVVLQASLANDYTVSVNRAVWSPDGSLFGVAYSKHIVHLYSYHVGDDDVKNFCEIEAHSGSVNDLAFSYPNDRLSVVTCGDDRAIKVWDPTTGNAKFIFEGHEAPVYSVCPHKKEHISFIFSTSTDGKIKAWLYDNLGSRVNYDAPDQSSTTMAYSADGKRLFSCGTNKEGESHLVEWNESEGTVMRKYNGLGKRSVGIVQFDTAKNSILAAGDESTVKFWDMDGINLLTSIDADGGLPASPCIKFNKDGALLAVSTSDNSIKIIANSDGIRLLRTVENRTFDMSRSASAAMVKVPSIGNLPSANASAGVSIGDRAVSVAPVVGILMQNNDARSLVDATPRIEDDGSSRSWKLTEISEPSQCCCLRLPDNLMATRVSRLVYTNSGMALLALASNAVHKFWKWKRNDRNPNMKATAIVVPQLWQPSSGILMTNDISDTNPEEAVACLALSKNDSYVISASGGKISLFNMMTFKTMITFMPPPPAATFLAFHPQDNNIMAIGMEDSTIQIYNVRVDEVKTKLIGHLKRISGLTFSHSLNILVSSGADSQLCVWSTDGWEKQSSKFLQIPSGWGSGSASLSDTRVQFHLDQTHLLVVHGSQIAIYKAPKLKCLKQFIPREASGRITHATYSCDSQLIYASFEDGSVGILTTALRMRCRINPTAYLPPNPRLRVHPLVIAAHPTEPNQFAIGLTDGGVHVLEPLDSQGKWGSSPPSENAPLSEQA